METETEEQVQPLHVKLKRKELPVIIEDENGEQSSYTLRELIGQERDQYMNSVARKSEQEGGKVTKVKDFMGTCSDLLCHCLFDARGMKVPSEKIQKFPTTAQVALFKAAANLSGLDRQEEEKAKND